ncbi:hypothetical protein JZ751_020491, partial [Albula glossodonta]
GRCGGLWDSCSLWVERERGSEDGLSAHADKAVGAVGHAEGGPWGVGQVRGPGPRAGPAWGGAGRAQGSAALQVQLIMGAFPGAAGAVLRLCHHLWRGTPSAAPVCSRESMTAGRLAPGRRYEQHRLHQHPLCHWLLSEPQVFRSARECGRSPGTPCDGRGFSRMSTLAPSFDFLPPRKLGLEEAGKDTTTASLGRPFEKIHLDQAGSDPRSGGAHVLSQSLHILKHPIHTALQGYEAQILYSASGPEGLLGKSQGRVGGVWETHVLPEREAQERGSLVERTIWASFRYLLPERGGRGLSEGEEPPRGGWEAEAEEEEEEGDQTLKQSLWPRGFVGGEGEWLAEAAEVVGWGKGEGPEAKLEGATHGHGPCSCSWVLALWSADVLRRPVRGGVLGVGGLAVTIVKKIVVIEVVAMAMVAAAVAGAAGAVLQAGAAAVRGDGAECAVGRQVGGGVEGSLHLQGAQVL